MVELQEGKDTAEFKAFVACASKLVAAIEGDLSIADQLLDKGLISDEIHEKLLPQSQRFSKRTKAGEIFSSVKNKIKEDKIYFDVFCDILEKNGLYYVDVYQLLKGKVGFNTMTICVQSTLPIADTLVQRPLSFIQRVSFIRVVVLYHLQFEL